MSGAVINPCWRLDAAPGRQGEGGRRCQLDPADAGPPPLLSVVTVVLDGGDLMARTMDSVLGWPRDRVEYIVVDGGSRDNTLAQIKAREDQLEYWLSEPDTGISDGFNKGISLCRGQVVGLINCGDWYEPEALAEVERWYRSDDPAGVLCGLLQFRRGGVRATVTDVRPELLDSNMSVAHPACFVRRDLYLRYGGFNHDYRLAMDYELLLRLFVAGVRFRRCPRVLANMEHGGVSEQRWCQGLWETHRARQDHIPDSPWARSRHVRWLILRKQFRFFLERFGLHGLVRLYREYLAPVRRTGSDAQ